MAELRHHHSHGTGANVAQAMEEGTHATHVTPISSPVGAPSSEHHNAAETEYNPKSKQMTEMKLTCCEKLVILLGGLVVATIMILVHHPEIYEEKALRVAGVQMDLAHGGKIVPSSHFSSRHSYPLIEGWATSEATSTFADANTKAHMEHSYNTDTSQLVLSSIGIGTYLGDTTDEVDSMIEDAVYTSVKRGVNVIDTAINYRGQKSERSIRAALQRLVANGGVKRESLFISTKGGFIPADADKSESPHRTMAEWSTRKKEDGFEFPDEEIVEGKHCIAPACLNASLHASRANLGLSTIDLFYLHNAAEKQMEKVDKDVFLSRLASAFEFLEEARALNFIRFYGLATWTCFTAEPGSDTSATISLSEVYRIAESVGGSFHGFRYVQAPVTITMPTVALGKYQEHGEQTLLDAAKELGITVMSSRSVGAARWDVTAAAQSAYKDCLAGPTAGSVGIEYAEKLRAAVTEGHSSRAPGSLRNSSHGGGLFSAAIHSALVSASEGGLSEGMPVSGAAMALLITRSVPGVTTALVGMKSANHVMENTALLAYPPIPAEVVMECMLTKAAVAVGLAAAGAKKVQPGVRRGTGRAGRGGKHGHDKGEEGDREESLVEGVEKRGGSDEKEKGGSGLGGGEEGGEGDGEEGGDEEKKGKKKNTIRRHRGREEKEERKKSRGKNRGRGGKRSKSKEEGGEAAES